MRTLSLVFSFAFIAGCAMWEQTLVAQDRQPPPELSYAYDDSLGRTFVTLTPSVILARVGAYEVTEMEIVTSCRGRLLRGAACLDPDPEARVEIVRVARRSRMDSISVAFEADGRTILLEATLEEIGEGRGALAPIPSGFSTPGGGGDFVALDTYVVRSPLATSDLVPIAAASAVRVVVGGDTLRVYDGRLAPLRYLVSELSL